MSQLGVTIGWRRSYLFLVQLIASVTLPLSLPIADHVLTISAHVLMVTAAALVRLTVSHLVIAIDDLDGWVPTLASPSSAYWREGGQPVCV